MKSDNKLSGVLLFIAIAIFLLIQMCSCTEEKVITEFVEGPTITRVDTFTRIDTVIQTVVTFDIRHYFHEVQYVFPGHNVYHVEEELQAIVSEFFDKAVAYGWVPIGGEMLISYAMNDEIPGEGWTSVNYYMFGQWVILLSPTVPPEYLYASIFRELAVVQLKKKYTRDGQIMDPLFDPYLLTLSTPEKNKPYLDKLFSK